jgi:RNA polymerase sigma-70 factor (ECF subfamily)
MPYRGSAPPIEEAQLVELAQGGNREAVEALLRLNAPAAYAFALRLTGAAAEAEDLSQTALMKAYRGLPGFRGDSGFRTWLFRILLNEFRSRRRARREEPLSLSEEAALDAAARAGPAALSADAPSESEILERVSAHLSALPDRQREALTLLVHHGCTYAEIASIMNCSYDAVKMHISLARRRLREALKGFLER